MIVMDDQTAHGTASGKVRLDPANGKLGGVCSGLAARFEIDPLIVRAIFVSGALVGFGSFIVLYLAIWLLGN